MAVLLDSSAILAARTSRTSITAPLWPGSDGSNEPLMIGR